MRAMQQYIYGYSYRGRFTAITDLQQVLFMFWPSGISVSSFHIKEGEGGGLRAERKKGTQIHEDTRVGGRRG